MESVLASLGALIVRALPTFFLLLLVHFYLKVIFFKPLEKALAQRKAATSGTRELADASLRKADQKLAEYEEKLRTERSKIFHDQEKTRAEWRNSQAAQIADLKSRLDKQIRESRQRVADAQATAKQALANESGLLAEQIANNLLAGRTQ